MSELSQTTIAADKIVASAEVAAAALSAQTAVDAALKLDAAAIAKALRLEEIKQENSARSLEYYKSFLLPLLLGLFASLPPTVAALTAGMVMWASLGERIDRYHGEVNHLKDELVASVKKSSHAEGVVQGKAEEQAQEKK